MDTPKKVDIPIYTRRGKGPPVPADDVCNAVAQGWVVDVADRTIDGPIDLRHHHARALVRFVNCQFTEHVTVAHARFDRSVEFEACVFHQGICFADSTVDGTLALRRCEVAVHPQVQDLLRAQAEAVSAHIEFPGSDELRERMKTATGNVNAWFARTAAGVPCIEQAYINFRRLRVSGTLDFEGSSFWACLDLSNAVAGQDVWFSSAQFRTAIWDRPNWPVCEAAYSAGFVCGKALCLSGANVRRQTNFRDVLNRRVDALGQVDLTGQFGSNIEFAGVRVRTPDEVAVNMSHARVGGAVLFSESSDWPFECVGQVDLTRARVGRYVNFRGATIRTPGQGSNAITIDLDGARISRNLFFRDGPRFPFVSYGSIDARAHVGCSLEFIGGTVFASGGLAINLATAKVRDNVAFHDSAMSIFRCFGQIDLRAHVGWSVDFLGARIEHQCEGYSEVLGTQEPQPALLMNSARIGGTVFFRKAINRKRGSAPTQIVGRVSMMNARCRNIRAEGLVCTRRFKADYLRTDGELNFTNSSLERGLDLMHATLGGDLRLNHCRLGGYPDPKWKPAHPDLIDRNDRDIALSLSQAVLHGRLLADSVQPVMDDREPVWGRWELEGAEIHGNVRVVGKADENGVVKEPDRAVIQGSLRMEDAVIEGEVNLGDCRIEGHLVMRSAEVRGRVFGDEQTQSPYPDVRGRIEMDHAKIKRIMIRFRPVNWDVKTPSRLPPISLQGVQAGEVVLAGMLADDQRRNELDPLVGPEILVAGMTFSDLDITHLTMVRTPQWARPQSYLRRPAILIGAALVLAVLILFQATEWGDGRRVFLVATVGSGVGALLAYFKLIPMALGLRSLGRLWVWLLLTSVAVFVSWRLHTGTRAPVYLLGLYVAYTVLAWIAIRPAAFRLLMRMLLSEDTYEDWSTPREEYLNRPDKKHPPRREHNTLLGSAVELLHNQRQSYWYRALRPLVKFTLPGLYKDAADAVRTKKVEKWKRVGVERRLRFLLRRQQPWLAYVLLWPIMKKEEFAQWCRPIKHPPVNQLRDRRQPRSLWTRAIDHARRRLQSSVVDRKLIDFLNRTRFSRDFYVAVEEAKRRAGDDEAADEVFLARRQREATNSARDDVGRDVRVRPIGDRLWRYTADMLYGYGARTGRLVHLVVLLGLINSCVFAISESVQHPMTYTAQRLSPVIYREDNHGRLRLVAPTTTTADAKADIVNADALNDPPMPPAAVVQPSTTNAADTARTPATTPSAKPTRYPTTSEWFDEGGRPNFHDETFRDKYWGIGHGFWMTVRISLPIVDWFADNDWTPSSRPMTFWGLEAVSYEQYATAMRAANLVLFPLLLAGLTGFLKRERS